VEIKSYNLENYQKEITSEIDIYKKQNIVQRLFDHGHTIWSESPDEIINRLGWLESFEEIHEGRKLKKGDEDLENSVTSLQQLLRSLAIKLSVELGKIVNLYLSRSRSNDPSLNFNENIDELIQKNRLSADAKNTKMA